MVCTHLISAYRKQFLPWKEEKTCHLTNPSPLHHLTLYLLYITDNKVKLPTKFYTSRWGTFKVLHHPQSTWLYTPYIYTDNKVKLSTKLYTSRWVRFNRHHPSQSTWLYTSYIYTDNKVKLSVYPYKRMGIVTTAAHPIFSFHGIPFISLLFPHFVIQTAHLHVKAS